MSDNPSYRNETEDGEENRELSEELLEDDDEHGISNNLLEELQSSFDKLKTNIVFDAIDTTELCTTRVIGQGESTPGPGSNEDNDEEEAEQTSGRLEGIKVASLEGYGELKKTNDYVQLFRSVIGGAKDEVERSQKINESLINYFSLLGSGVVNEIDINFLESLSAVADLNTRDIYGQTIMHEVARDWSTDIARLLQLKGMHIDSEDSWGRTPLFVAVTSNHLDMIEWLINNGANINHKTICGQGQSPIHFAAKHCSIEALDLLINLGADPLMRDDQDRTPFFVASLAGHPKMVQHMLEMELPCVAYSSGGEATIDHIIQRLPNEMAQQALNQFTKPSLLANRYKFYLSCLTKRRWKLLAQHKLNPVSCKTEPPGPLEIILDRQNIELIMHPAILKLLEIKTEYFAQKYINYHIFIHLFFTLIWTLSVSLFFEDTTWYSAHGVLILTSLGELTTIVFMFKFYFINKALANAKRDEKDRLLRECYIEKRYCHPRWGSDKMALEREIEAAGTISYSIFDDAWNIVELTCLTMANLQFLVTVVYISLCDDTCVIHHKTSHVKQWDETRNLKNVKSYFSSLFIVVTWVRMNICLRHTQFLGPLIQMLYGCLESFIQIAFLFVEFFIPFCVAGWVLFGGAHLHKEETEYNTLSDLIYQVYLITIVGDFDYDPLTEVNALAAQLFVGIYVLAVSIITINLYIGLLSEAYSSISATANARAYLQLEAEIRKIELLMPEVKKDFEVFLNKNCAPLIVTSTESADSDNSGSARVIIKEALISVGSIQLSLKNALAEQESLKQELGSINSMLNGFQRTYSPNKSNVIISEFKDVRKNEERFLVKLTMSTDKVISSLMERIKDFW